MKLAETKIEYFLSAFRSGSSTVYLHVAIVFLRIVHARWWRRIIGRVPRRSCFSRNYEQRRHFAFRRYRFVCLANRFNFFRLDNSALVEFYVAREISYEEIGLVWKTGAKTRNRWDDVENNLYL